MDGYNDTCHDIADSMGSEIQELVAKNESLQKRVAELEEALRELLYVLPDDCDLPWDENSIRGNLWSSAVKTAEQILNKADITV